jgi:protein CpxP
MQAHELANVWLIFHTSTRGVIDLSPFVHVLVTPFLSNQLEGAHAMNRTMTRIALGVGAGLIALGVTAGVYAAAQDQNTSQPPPPFSGRGMGPGRGGPMGGGMGPGGPMGFLPMLGRKLQLTDAQREQIKGIVDSHRDEWKALADRARPAHDALNAAVTSGSVDEALVRQKAADLAAVEADMAVGRARAFAEVFQILTDDQKARLKTLESAMKDRMKAGQDARRGRRQRLLERFGL